MSLTQIECAYCGCLVFKQAGVVNRARRICAPIYCGRACAGLGRRNGKTIEERRAEKKEYDARRRVVLADQIKAAKHEYFKRTYDPVKAAEHRQTRMPYHVEYCRRPEYRTKKKVYDRVYRAKKDYGPLWECQVLTLQIREAALSIMSDYEIRLSKGTLTKRQQRKRDYERSLREESQVGPLGNLELGQGWQNGGLASGLRSVAGSRNSANHEHSVACSSAGQASGLCGSDHVRGNLTRLEHGNTKAREASHG